MLTLDDVAVLESISNYQYAHHGASPTYDKICVATGFRSRSSVFTHVRRLIERGWLRRIGGHRGQLEILRMPEPQQSLANLVDALLESIIEDNPESGRVVVSSAAIGALDIMRSEQRARGHIGHQHRQTNDAEARHGTH